MDNNKIYLIRGNDTDMTVRLGLKEQETTTPYDLTGAEHVRLSIVGQGKHHFAENVEIGTGADSNSLTGKLLGRPLLLGLYDLEVAFTLDGYDKRFLAKGLVEVVDAIEDDADGEAEGEGAGIVVTLTIQPEEIAFVGEPGPTGPTGPTGPEGPQGPKGDTPVLSADEDGTIYADGVLLTEVVKDAAEQAIDAAQEAEEAAETIDAKIADKAEKDGYYPEMSVGSLVGTEVTQVEGITAIAKSTGLAKINEVMGKSLVWNQLISDDVILRGFQGTCTKENDKYVLAGSNSSTTYFQAYNDNIATYLAGHKYYVSAIFDDFVKTSQCYFGLANLNSSSAGAIITGRGRLSHIFSISTTGVRFAVNAVKAANEDGYSVSVQDIVIIDLTQLFGSGNEPSTVAEFESWLASDIGYRDYYAYNPGEIISNNTEALEITGLNQWDGEYTEADARYLTDAGVISAAINYRITSYIEVLSNTAYYFKNVVAYNASAPAICWYDSEKNFISGVNGFTNIYNKVITSPLNARYLRCSIYKPTADISSVSVSGSRNGQYEPYQKSEFALNLPTITGKLNGEGESVVIFSEGMRSAGTAFDSLIVDEDGWCRRAVRRLVEVDMGSLGWSYNSTNQNYYYQLSGLKVVKDCGLLCTKYTTVPNASFANSDKAIATSAAGGIIQVRDTAYTDIPTFKSANTGVPLIYELATPQEYVLDTPIYMGIQTKQGGVIWQKPENGSAPTTAPMRMDIVYALPAEALISGASLENLLNALKSANKISNYTMTYNPTSGKWEFTIS